MSIKTTKKSIMQTYSTVMAVGYCKLANLLADLQPLAHTERAEGWGADIYLIGAGIVIATGYAPFGNIKPASDICDKYNELARIAIRDNNCIVAFDKLQDLRQQFVQEVLTNEQA